MAVASRGTQPERGASGGVEMTSFTWETRGSALCAADRAGSAGPIPLIPMEWFIPILISALALIGALYYLFGAKNSSPKKPSPVQFAKLVSA